MLQNSMFIQLVNQNESAQALDRQTRALISDFRQVEGLTAILPEEDAPSGSLGDPVTVGTIALALVTGGGVTAIVQILSDWLRRGENRKVVMKLSINKNSFEVEFPSKEITQKDILELAETIKRLIETNPKPRG